MPSIVTFVRRRLGFGRIELISGKTDRKNHQSGAFFRALLSSGRRRAGLIAADESLPPDMADRFVADMVLWWDRNAGGREIPWMILLVPVPWRQRIVSLLPFLKIPLRCFEFEPGSVVIREIYPRAEAPSDLLSPYIVYPGCPAPGVLEKTRRQFPQLDLIFRKNRWELSHLGLPVIWIDSGGSGWYDFRRPKRMGAHPEEYRRHIRQVIGLRAGDSACRNSYSYMFGPERWLESLLIKDLSCVKPGLGPQFYCQVPSCLGMERKILDILASDEKGRLVVLEVKTECRIEDIFQGLGYRERVGKHLSEGDFQKKGYFDRVELSDSVPLLGFVSPLFAFHRTCPVIWRYLDPGGEVFFLGINSNWREGIRPLRRFSLETGRMFSNENNPRS